MDISDQTVRPQRSKVSIRHQAETSRRSGMVAIGLGIVLFLTTYLFQSSVNYPKSLIERPGLALPLFMQGGITLVVAPIGFLVSGILIFLLSRNLASISGRRGWKHLAVLGTVIGALWVIGALTWVLFVPEWAQNGAASNAGIVESYQTVAPLLLGLSGIVMPVLLAMWTVLIARVMFRSNRAIGFLGILGAIGLILTALRSVIWLINTGLSVEEGHFALSGLLSILAWILEPVWLIWLFSLSVWVLRGWMGELQKRESRRMERPGILMVLKQILLRVGTILAIAVFIIVRTVMMLNAPIAVGNGIPREPSLSASLFYYGLLMPIKYLAPLTIDKTINANRQDPVQEPIGITVESANITGVSAKTYCAPNADKAHFILYIHGGGFVAGVSNDYRQFAGMLSQLTGACVLLPDYRLAPAHPFPAALDDNLLAYHWLLQQGVKASQIVIGGDSAGGNLTLAVAFSLRDHGDPMPTALYLDSPALDLAATGETMVSKSLVDPLIPVDYAKNAFAIYLGGDLTKVRDSLASPLYGDMRGLTPTLIQVGSEEILLSDSTRAAEQMQAAGINVKLDIWPGMWHTFPLIGTQLVLPETTLAIRQMTDYIRASLNH